MVRAFQIRNHVRIKNDMRFENDESYLKEMSSKTTLFYVLQILSILRSNVMFSKTLCMLTKCVEQFW